MVNYSSEVSAEFMPDSIGAEGSTVDIQELLDTVLENASVFGPDRDTQSRTRKENFDDLVEILKTEKRFGNTVLQSFARNGIEDFDFAILSMSSRVVNVSPLLKLTLSILRMKNLSLYGVQKFS